jgi:amino acid adenylation domain-containing protein
VTSVEFTSGGNPSQLLRFSEERPVAKADQSGRFMNRSQRDVLEERLQGRKPRRVIPVAAAEGAVPLSFEQQSIFVDSELRRDPATYNRPCVFRLSGELDRAALERSLQAIVLRHSVLRCTIRNQSGKLQQALRDDSRLELTVHDFTGLAEAERAAWAEVSRASRLPFDLAAGPAFRFSVSRIDDREHLLHATFHHVVFDAASEVIFGEELAAHYEAFHRGVVPSLPVLPIQYQDYAIWQQGLERREPRKIARAIEYWKRTLESIPHSALAEEAGGGLTRTVSIHTDFCLRPGLVSQLRQFCAQSSVTPFMALLSVFAVLLHRYTGNEEIVAGCPISRRNRPDLERLIGLLIDTKPFAIQVEPLLSFSQLLSRTRETCIEALSHDDVTLQQLTASGAIRRATGGAPLFDAFFVLEAYRPTDALSAGLEIRSERVPAIFDSPRCLLEIADVGDRVTGTLHCGLHQFQGATSEQVVGHFVRLLEGALGGPEQRVCDLPLLSEEERRTILVAWNETSGSFPRDLCLHHLFEQQVDLTPDLIAVVFDDEALSYRQLNERSDRLAGYLRGLGVSADVAVGLHGERSIDMLVGLLGILKSGGAYVPLPVGGPRQRYLAIAHDSKLLLVVAGRNAVDVPRDSAYKVIFADAAGPAQAEVAERMDSGGARPESLACILYTSGSTGKPKGVCIEHRGLVNLMSHRLGRQFSPDHFQIAAMTSPLTFDASITQIFSPLFTGGTLVITRGVEELLASPWYDRLTALAGASTLIAELASVRGLPKTVRLVAVGAEPVPRRLLDLVKQHPTVERLDVMYGLTECSGYSTAATLFQRLPEGDQPAERVATDDTAVELRSIGRPIMNTRAYVLDRHLQPLPPGITGELFLGGVGLARGFLGDATETDRCFMRGPFTEGARLYRTGDLARWRPGGELEFLGRIDQQIKLRGNRIELGEIDVAFASHPDISVSRSILRDQQTAAPRLVMYFVPRAGANPQPPELRRYARERLVEYMVPSAFVSMAALPLTANGKLDHRALPAAEVTDQELGPEIGAPRTAIELRLIDLWAELLDRPHLGIHDNFFELGGHSVLALELFARIEREFKQQLPLATLFSHGTVAQLCTLLVEPKSEGSPVKIVELQKGAPGRIPLLIMPSLSGDLLWSRPIILGLERQTPVYGLQPDFSADSRLLFDDFQAMVALYVDALLGFQSQGSFALAGYSYGGWLAYEIARQLRARGAQVGLLAILDTGPELREADLNFASKLHALRVRIQNFPAWFRDNLVRSSAPALLRRMATRLRLKVRRLIGSRGGEKMNRELLEFVEITQYSPESIARMSSLLGAIQSYQPGLYPGRLTLIRASTRRLMCGPEPDLGWGRFAEGGVDLRIVDGFHGNLLAGPAAPAVSQELNELFRACADRSGERQ